MIMTEQFNTHLSEQIFFGHTQSEDYCSFQSKDKQGLGEDESKLYG